MWKSTYRELYESTRPTLIHEFTVRGEVGLIQKAVQTGILPKMTDRLEELMKQRLHDTGADYRKIYKTIVRNRILTDLDRQELTSLHWNSESNRDLLEKAVHELNVWIKSTPNSERYGEWLKLQHLDIEKELPELPRSRRLFYMFILAVMLVLFYTVFIY